MKLASLLEWACSVITVATVLANSCLWVSLSERRYWITDENRLDKTSRTLENAWKSQETGFLKIILTYFINQEQVFKNNIKYFINTHIRQNIANTGKSLEESRTGFLKII